MASTTTILFSGLAQANSANSQGKYESNIYGINASLASRQADDAFVRGREAEYRSRIGTRRLIGKQRAALGAQGIEIDSGSGADIQDDAVAMGALDVMTIRNNAAREAWGYNVQAEGYRMRGKLARSAGKNRAYSTLLSTGLGAQKSYKENNSPKDELFGPPGY